MILLILEKNALYSIMKKSLLLKSYLLFRDSRALQNGYKYGDIVEVHMQNSSINIDDYISVKCDKPEPLKKIKRNRSINLYDRIYLPKEAATSKFYNVKCARNFDQMHLRMSRLHH